MSWVSASEGDKWASLMKELVEVFLPERILEWFNVKKVEKDDKVVRIIPEKKNMVPLSNSKING